MMKKALIALHGNDVAPRFDLATEVMIASFAPDGSVEEDNIVVLPQASAEKLCHMILTEDIQTVVCGGIEEEYYQYLTWKRVKVLDSVMGPYELALERLREGVLQPGDILFDRVRKV
jgi:predicted Fe-Mo cluster-binding NifX family protein